MAMPSPPVTPADRSISARMITNVSAIASIISAAVWVNRLAMLVLVKKKGVGARTGWLSTTRPPRAGSMPISPPRTRWM